MRTKGLVVATAGFTLAVTAVCLAGVAPAKAQGVARSEMPHASVSQPVEATAQSRRRRAPTQLRVIQDRGYLPPSAVRECHAWYAQEFRPSGTVIVPRMRCRWVAS